MDTIKVKMLKDINGCYFGSNIISLEYLKINKDDILKAKTNTHGAISVILKDGSLLGVKPDEFEFIEAPAWVLEKHGKLSEKYEQLLKENENLTKSLKLFSNEFEKRLELQERNQELINLCYTALKACGYCPVRNDGCGINCSIKDIRAYMLNNYEGVGKCHNK